jgi:hypothetical protein
MTKRLRNLHFKFNQVTARYLFIFKQILRHFKPPALIFGGHLSLKHKRDIYCTVKPVPYIFKGTVPGELLVESVDRILRTRSLQILQNLLHTK